MFGLILVFIFSRKTLPFNGRNKVAGKTPSILGMAMNINLPLGPDMVMICLFQFHGYGIFHLAGYGKLLVSRSTFYKFFDVN